MGLSILREVRQADNEPCSRTRGCRSVYNCYEFESTYKVEYTEPQGEDYGKAC